MTAPSAPPCPPSPASSSAGGEIFPCNTCGKTFTRSFTLRTHQRVHTGERPYACNVCGKSFTRSFTLRRHERVHTGEKPYKCQRCDQSFSQSSHLTRHERVHTGERPFSCTLCDKSFSVSYALTRHMRVHKSSASMAEVALAAVATVPTSMTAAAASAALAAPTVGASIPSSLAGLASFGANAFGRSASLDSGFEDIPSHVLEEVLSSDHDLSEPASPEYFSSHSASPACSPVCETAPATSQMDFGAIAASAAQQVFKQQQVAQFQAAHQAMLAPFCSAAPSAAVSMHQPAVSFASLVSSADTLRHTEPYVSVDDLKPTFDGNNLSVLLQVAQQHMRPQPLGFDVNWTLDDNHMMLQSH